MPQLQRLKENAMDFVRARHSSESHSDVGRNKSVHLVHAMLEGLDDAHKPFKYTPGRPAVNVLKLDRTPIDASCVDIENQSMEDLCEYLASFLVRDIGDADESLIEGAE